MSWYYVPVKLRNGRPTHIYINEWIELGSVSRPNPRKDGTSDYRATVGQEWIDLLHKEGKWYIGGSGPDDDFHP